MLQPLSERRRSPRLEGNIPVKIHCEDFDLVTETRNLSCTGAYCQVSKYLEPMTKLLICLLLPFKKHEKIVTKKISFSGVVVRSESQPGDKNFNIAIYFNDIPPKEKKILSDYIDSTLASRTSQS